MRKSQKLAVLIALCAPATAWCGDLSASASCLVNTGVDVLNCVPLSPSSYVPPGTATSTASGGIGEAEYRLRADYGNLGIYLDARTLASAGEVSTYASAEASASFFDEVQVTSSTLAPGTPVIATATFTIDGQARADSTSIIGEVTSSSYAFLRADYEIYALGVSGPLLQFSACSASSPQFTSGCSAVYTSESASYSFSFQTLVGSYLLVQGSLVGQVNATVGANSAAGAFPMNYGQVSSLNSSHTYLSAQGASFIGATGHQYAQATPVPEPATVALLGMGLATLSLVSRRRKSAPGETRERPAP